ncbi:hypothetical protein DPMN_135394 [Dreissena polymorpha]|uniref:Uncharacterized protein n=1 Tax=Dreissena polymorpha TaxID=45954 RepID=A0A9D4FZ30_DREPO|nr:hypothetical protein DPMN_135394 [Dreissena polymorpha]
MKCDMRVYNLHVVYIGRGFPPSDVIVRVKHQLARARLKSRLYCFCHIRCSTQFDHPAGVDAWLRRPDIKGIELGTSYGNSELSLY